LGLSLFFGSLPPPGEHQARPIELFLFAGLIGIPIAVYAVFRCPKCNATLIPAFSASWGKLHYCPKCGVELKEK